MQGADASTPEKELSPTVTWGVAAAKGPRHAMEDAHTAAPNIGNLPDSAQATSFFAVRLPDAPPVGGSLQGAYKHRITQEIWLFFSSLTYAAMAQQEVAAGV